MDFAETYSGIRVLDLSENIAGPLSCMILADLGADVIKVERPGTGEATRNLPPRWRGTDEATVFLGFNRNKRSLAIDIRSDEGREAVLRIAEQADVVVESFRPGVAARLGLGLADLEARNPRLIHCAVNAFGTGPLGHDRPGYDALIQAFTGIMEMTGEPEGGPARAAPSIIDTSTGMWAAMAIMAALRRRDAGHEGPQSLEAALVDSGFFLMAHQVMGLEGTGAFPGRLGSAAPSASPYQVWSTATRPVMIATSTDGQYAKLCATLGLDDLAADPRFATMEGRIAGRGEIADAIQAVLVRESADHWLEVLGAAGIPGGPVLDLAEAVAHPLTVERGMVADAEPGRIPGLRQLRLPMDRGRSAPLRQPPAVGEHNDEILAELGLTKETP